MKVSDVLGSYHALNVLCNSQLKASTAYKLSKMQTVLQKEFDEFQRVRTGKLKDFSLVGKVDNNTGVLQMPEKPTKKERGIIEENYKDFLSEIEELAKGESDFKVPDKTIFIDDLVKSDGSEIDIPAAVLTQLIWIIGD